ncbi:hypothetical protein SDC9_132166 [bioreactor metagenome]|uniref:Uncharacterized protein n=1 Tax=bioreactor metagenome TaxID=1076179 RepID=A0A645D789_9ZZZZ
MRSSYPSAKLMEGREAEPFGVLDDHAGCIGNVDANLHHAGGDKIAELSLLVVLEDGNLLLLVELAVDECGRNRRVLTLEKLVHAQDIPQVALPTVIDARIDEVGLMATQKLHPHRLVHAFAALFVDQMGDDALPALGHGVQG